MAGNDFLKAWAELAQDKVDNADLADLAEERIMAAFTHKQAAEAAVTDVGRMKDTLDLLAGIIRDLEPTTLAWFAGVVQSCNYDQQMRLDHVVEILERGLADLTNLEWGLDEAAMDRTKA